MLLIGPFPKGLPASESPAGLHGTFPLARAGKTDPAARQWATRQKRPTPGRSPKTIWKASTATPARENGLCPAKCRFPPHRPYALLLLRRPGLLPSLLPLPAKRRCPGGGPEALHIPLAGRDETGFFHKQHCKTLQTPALPWYSLPSTPFPAEAGACRRTPPSPPPGKMPSTRRLFLPAAAVLWPSAGNISASGPEGSLFHNF